MQSSTEPVQAVCSLKVVSSTWSQLQEEGLTSCIAMCNGLDSICIIPMIIWHVFSTFVSFYWCFLDSFYVKDIMNSIFNPKSALSMRTNGRMGAGNPQLLGELYQIHTSTFQFLEVSYLCSLVRGASSPNSGRRNMASIYTREKVSYLIYKN